MMGQEEDGELVRRAVAGERCAFAALVARYRNMVYGAAYHALGHPEDAQDAAQEAFVQAYCRLAQLREPAKFAPWLRRLTQNLCRDQLRRPNAVTAVAETARTDERLDRLTTRLVVQDALSRLSDKTRLTVMLCYLGGYSHAEIARFLEIPVNTVRSRLQHAKRQLREEMRDMVSETINEGKPDEAWTRQVVEKAMRRGADALHSFERGEAVRHYDEALAALDALPPDAARKRLMMDALWHKGKTLGDIPLMEQALTLAEELGDRRELADKLVALGGALYNANRPEYEPRVTESYRRAQAVYEEIGDRRRQAHCLMSLGTGRLWGDGTQARLLFEEALALLEAADDLDGVAYCRAMLAVTAEVGPENLSVRRTQDGSLSQPIVGFYAGSDVFKAQDGVITHPSERCYIGYTWEDDLARSPLQIFRVFWQLSHVWKLLDARVPVGGSWSGNAFSFSDEPLQASVTVLSDTEPVTTPAGTFPHCLLTEQVTTEDGPPDERNRELCGTRRAWYAPAVGLVQLHVRRGDGIEATIQLREFSVAGESSDALPLAVGNRWEYGWADLPEDYAAKEVYQVRAQRENLWYVEHYSYADRYQRRSTP